MKLALAEVDRRYGGSRIEDRDFVDRMLLAKNDPRPAVSRSSPDNEIDSRIPQWPESEPAAAVVPTAKFVTYAEDVIAQNAKAGHWDEKTQRQAKSIATLFAKFMLQDQGVLDLNLLRQPHVGKFVDFLSKEIYRNYGKSNKDAHRTIAELRKIAEGHKEADRGIEGDTLNRHLTFLGQIFRHVSARGVEALAKIDLTALRVKDKKETRARDERPKLAIEQVRKIFETAPFNNSAAWDALRERGPEGLHQVFHCALYFVPILMYYTGCRRKELCGLMVDDVVFDNGEIPYIHIAANKQRRIKNSQSRRNIPLHPEVMRLNFSAYVEAIKALGYELLFPDLYSRSSRSPLGNRFYKQFKPVLVSVGVTEEGLGSHAVRHLFGAQLKKEKVAEEDRADLLGHGGSSETSERYCEPHEITMLYGFVQKLPVVTANLQPREIKLLPWVQDKETAPFARPSLAKRKELTN